MNRQQFSQRFAEREYRFLQTQIPSSSGPRRVARAFEKDIHGEDLEAEFSSEVEAAQVGTNLSNPVSLSVILAPWPASIFVHEVIGHTLEADEYERSIETTQIRLGSLASLLPFDVIDDPRMADSPIAFEKDFEGVETRSKFLIRQGYWNDLLGTKAFAKRWGDVSGNARTSELGHSPLPRMSTTYLDGETQTLTEWIGKIQYGILCEGAWGGRGALNQFITRPSFGRVIRNGSLTGEIWRSFDVVGRKTDALMGIIGLAGERRVFAPPFGCDKAAQNGLPVAHGSPHLVFEKLELKPVGGSRA